MYLVMVSWKLCRIMWILTFGVLMLTGCTDHKTTISFEFPEYKPRLVVLSSVGSISGGEASISWSKPLRGQAGTVPALPKLTVFLLEEGVRISQFNAVSDSVGYFVIKQHELNLKVGTAYAIEILVGENGERILSKNCYLPEKPILEDVKVAVDQNAPFWYELSWSQGRANEATGAIALYPFLLDAEGNWVETPGLGCYYLSHEFRYTDGESVPERKGKKRFERQIKKEGQATGLAKAAEVRLAFLSPELVRFKKEIDQLGYLGESIFQTVRPLYSNMAGAAGIFGLYNESSAKVQFGD